MIFHFFQILKTNKFRSQFKLAPNDFQDFNENNSSLSENLPESEAYSPLSVSDSIQSSVVQESLIEIPANFEISINEPFPLEKLEGFSRNEEISIIKSLLKILTIPRHLIRKVIKLSKKNRIILLSIVRICFLCLCCYYAMIFIYNILLPFLMSALKALKEKIDLQRSKLKQRLNNPDQIQESEEFWDNHLGSLSQIIKINRGGSLVAIREANIYNFSELDEQQALLSISPIPAYIEFERSKSELEKFIVKSEQKRFSLKALKEFPSKLKTFPSKFNKFIPLRHSRLRKRLQQILLGITLCLVLETGNPMFERTRRTMNFETVSTMKGVIRPALPVFESTKDKVLVKGPQTIESILTETKDIMKTPSRLGSENRARKRAKLVQLADLPPLSEQNFNREIESISNAKPTAIRIRLN
jgi:hypothetical protein